MTALIKSSVRGIWARPTYAYVSKETYCMVKEAYYMAKETCHMAKETYSCTGIPERIQHQPCSTSHLTFALLFATLLTAATTTTTSSSSSSPSSSSSFSSSSSSSKVLSFGNPFQEVSLITKERRGHEMRRDFGLLQQVPVTLEQRVLVHCQLLRYA